MPVRAIRATSDFCVLIRLCCAYRRELWINVVLVHFAIGSPLLVVGISINVLFTLNNNHHHLPLMQYQCTSYSTFWRTLQALGPNTDILNYTTLLCISIKYYIYSIVFAPYKPSSFITRSLIDTPYSARYKSHAATRYGIVYAYMDLVWPLISQRTINVSV